ncbi:MAG: PIN domain-containing protein [Nevskiales bacterium]
MRALFDTSVILASLDPDEPHHAACDRLLSGGGHALYIHALAETFSILTGGRNNRRLSAATVVTLIKDSVLPYVKTQALSATDVMSAISECNARGVRGGAIYDLLHLSAARKAGVDTLVTLDLRNFQALAQPGDLRIERP